MQTHLPQASTLHTRDTQLTDSEWQQYRQAVQSAKKALGIERLCLITPVGSLPKTHQDTGVGSLLGAVDFFEFTSRLGFDTYQLDPTGKRKRGDASPYIGT